MANHRHSNTQARLGNRRILVVLNGIVEAEAFRRATGLGRRDEQQAEVRVIAPALNSRIRHWLSDEDEARRRAHLRLAATLESLCAAGIEADGRVGDADPLQAIDDALVEFHPEEIVIVTQPDRHSHWTTRDLPGKLGAASPKPWCRSSPSRKRTRGPRSLHGLGGRPWLPSSRARG